MQRALHYVGLDGMTQPWTAWGAQVETCRAKIPLHVLASKSQRVHQPRLQKDEPGLQRTRPPVAQEWSRSVFPRIS